MSNHLKGILAVSLGSIFLGSIGIFVRYAGDSIPPMTQTFGRIFFAFIFITLFNLLRSKKSLKTFMIEKKDIFLFVINGLVGFSLMAATFTLSVLFTSISNTYFLLYTAPIWVVVLSFLFFHEKIKKSMVIAIIISILGLLFLFNPTNLHQNLLGNIFGLITGIAFGVYFVVTGLLGKKYSSPNISFWTTLFGGIGLLPLVFIFDGGASFFHTIEEWLPVIVAGLIVFIGYLFLTYGLKKIKPSLGSILSLFEPLSALVFGILFFSELPGMSALVGSALILCSIVYLTRQTEDSN